MVRIKKDTVGVLGLSKSGLAVAKLYNKLGFKVKGFDDNYNLVVNENYKNYFSEIFLGKQPQYVINEIKNYKYLVVSPGVPFDHPIIQFARSQKVPVISEIEAAYKTMSQRKTIIGITGTNGKSTVSTLIYQFIKSLNDDVYLAGNIGYPFSEVAYECMDKENITVVLELSSFQLKMTNNFRSQISVITNITSDHLDRHESFEDYVNSKLKLLYFQLKKDYAIINEEDGTISKFLQSDKLKSSLGYFRSFNYSNFSNTSFKDKSLYACFDGKKIMILCKGQSVFELPISSLNNPLFKQEGIYLENLLPSLLAFYIYSKYLKKVDFDRKSIVDVIDDFVPLAYRLKSEKKWGKFEFFNDSKATNLAATKSSIDTVKNYFLKNGVRRYGIILLVGGVPKYSNKEDCFKEIEKLFSGYEKDLIGVLGFGKYADVFINPFAKFSLKYLYAFNSMELAFGKAVNLAFMEQENYDSIAILLAPGGASFDEFKSAEERGKFFENLVDSFLKLKT